MRKMDVIITTNSPGEVSAWVRPMVKAIRVEWPDAQITVFVPPCTFASGREVPVLRGFPEVNQVVGPGAYVQYALFRKKPRGFKPGSQGFVLFLGGDLGHATLLGKRLHYPVYAYTERDAGHAEMIRYFFVPGPKVTRRLQSKGIQPDQIQVVGDLMHDAIKPATSREEMLDLFDVHAGQTVVNLFPGSRPYEVKVTLPLFVKAVALLKKEMPEIKPIITLAPFLTVEQIRRDLTQMGLADWRLAEGVRGDERLAELHCGGEQFLIYRGNSYDTMQLTHIALSLPGTNNVELAAMGVPTFVVLPLNWPELIPLPGVVGLIGQVPVLGSYLKRRIVIPKLLPKFPFVSPVNRSAGERIFPELAAIVEPAMIAQQLKLLLEEQYDQIKEHLCAYRKEEKASCRIISRIREDFLAYHEKSSDSCNR